MEPTTPEVAGADEERLSALATHALWTMLSIDHVYATGTRVAVRRRAGGLQAQVLGGDSLDSRETARARARVGAALQVAAPDVAWIHFDD
jgi:hypothetical protein